MRGKLLGALHKKHYGNNVNSIIGLNHKFKEKTSSFLDGPFLTRTVFQVVLYGLEEQVHVPLLVVDLHLLLLLLQRRVSLHDGFIHAAVQQLV